MSEPGPVDDRGRLLDEAIAEYLIAADAGRAPEAADFLARHPDLREELGQFLADRAGLERMVEPLRAAPMPADPGARTAIEDFGAGRTEAGEPTVAGSSEATAARPAGDDPTHADQDREGLPGGATVRYFGDYKILRVLGRGGMGIVYRATQMSLNRPVALKMIRAGVLADEADLRRFQNEAESVALLDHPGIVPVYEVGDHDGQRYFSMKLVEGGTLADRLSAYRYDPRGAAKLLSEAAEAVHHAHTRGILHRDLKPANLLVDAQGRPQITDFGLAKRVAADAEMTASGAILGTPAYMSPEQAAGRRGTITTATDVYGLGSILYALLTGRAPFAGEGVVDTLTMVREQPPNPPRKLNATVPRDLEVICLKSLAKDPRRRYASAQALADDLRAWLGSRPISARPAGPTARAWLWCKRRPAVAALSALVALVALAGFAAAGTQWRAAVANALAASRSARQATDNAERALQHEREAVRRGDALARSSRRLGLAGYASAMQLARREWELGDVPRVRAILGSLRPAAGEVDLRGFEWNYLLRQCDDAVLTLRPPDATSPRSGRPTRVEIRPGAGLCLAINSGRVDAWELPSGRPAAFAPGRDRSVFDARFSPDGRRVATLGLAAKGPFADPGYPPAAPASLDLWDARTGERLRSTELPISDNGALAFRPGGRQIAVRLTLFEGLTIDTGHSRVIVVDAETGGVAWKFEGRPINEALAYSPDGTLLAGPVDSKTLAIWEAETGREVGRIDTNREIIRDAAFHPDGKRLALADDNGRVRIFSVPGWEPLQSLRVSEQMALRCRFSPDGKTLATLGQGLIKIWDGSSGDYRFSIQGARSELILTPDGKQVASADEGGTVRLWDATRAQGALVHLAKESLYHARFGHEGRRIVDDEGTILDAASGAIVRSIPTPEGEQSGPTVLLPDGKHAILARSKVGTPTVLVTTGDLILWDLEAAREVKRLAGIALPTCLDVSRDGRWLLSLSSQEGDSTYKRHELVVRDATSLEPVLTRKDPPIYGRYAVFSADSKSILLGLQDRVALVEVPSGREKATFGPLATEPLALALSDDGRWIAAAPSVQRPMASTIHLWDAASGAEVRVIPQTASEDVTTLAFSPDGRRLASAGFDAKVKVWDTESGLEVLTLAGHTSWIWEVWFSPDGRRIVSCGRDRTLRIWDAGPPTPGGPYTP